MLSWVNFLHLYQPPGQDQETLRKVAKESYFHIIDLFKKNPRFKATLNISGSLLEQLDTPDYRTFFEEIKTLIKAGRIELVGSAMYHPILSLLPAEEIQRQITLHHEIAKRIFGELYQPTGFYLPEMAYDAHVGDVIASFGFKWIILDEAHLGSAPKVLTKYVIQKNGLAVVFRNRKFSKTFPPESIVKNLESIKDEYIVTAHDGELYGHWHKNDGGYYEKAFNHPGIQMITVSEYLKGLTKVEYIVPKKTHWEATANEISSKIYFSLWDHPNNKIHNLLWKLAYLAIKAVEENKENPNYGVARPHLDRGLSSCSWWWAAEAKPDIFSPVTWNPDMIERGAKELIISVRALKGIAASKKIAAEKAYSDAVFAVWSNHWEKYI